MTTETTSLPDGRPEREYPLMAAEPGRVEPAPRRVRAFLDGHQVFDTTQARYVWEWPNYPQYYIPIGDVDRSLLVDEQHEHQLGEGVVLAETDCPVMVFETGLPTRYYFDRTDVRFDHLIHTDTETAVHHGVLAADRRAGRVLQREGQRVRRRCRAASAPNPPDPLGRRAA